MFTNAYSTYLYSFIAPISEPDITHELIIQPENSGFKIYVAMEKQPA